MRSPKRSHALCLAAALLAGGAVARAQEAVGPVAPASMPADAGSSRWGRLSPDAKARALNVGVLGFIAAWGAVNWDYGDNAWKTTDEGWFGADTKEGGADKAGHLYTGYVLGRGLAGSVRAFGHDERRAAWIGAASSLAAMTFMEFGDGFSPYGFSREDQAMNVAGAGIAWLLAAHPALDRKFALRGEYRASADYLGDVFTDYDRWRYYATLKLDGFERMPRALRWVELHAGYFARGYADQDPANDRRETFVGIGLSLTKAAREAGWRKTGVFLDYFQPPGTVWRDDRRR